MKLVYTHPSIVAVTHIASALERAGISASLRNEYAAGAIGELAPIDAWPELWIEEKDWERAQEVLDRAGTVSDLPDWSCANCGRENPGSFEFCYHCGADKQGA